MQPSPRFFAWPHKVMEGQPDPKKADHRGGGVTNGSGGGISKVSTGDREWSTAKKRGGWKIVGARVERILDYQRHVPRVHPLVRRKNVAVQGGSGRGSSRVCLKSKSRGRCKDE